MKMPFVTRYEVFGFVSYTYISDELERMMYFFIMLAMLPGHFAIYDAE